MVTDMVFIVLVVAQQIVVLSARVRIPLNTQIYNFIIMPIKQVLKCDLKSLNSGKHIKRKVGGGFYTFVSYESMFKETYVVHKKYMRANVITLLSYLATEGVNLEALLDKELTFIPCIRIKIHVKKKDYIRTYNYRCSEESFPAKLQYLIIKHLHELNLVAKC